MQESTLLKSTLSTMSGKPTARVVKEKLRDLEQSRLNLLDELAKNSASIALWQEILESAETGTTPTELVMRYSDMKIYAIDPKYLTWQPQVVVLYY